MLKNLVLAIALSTMGIVAFAPGSAAEGASSATELAEDCGGYVSVNCRACHPYYPSNCGTCLWYIDTHTGIFGGNHPLHSQCTRV